MRSVSTRMRTAIGLGATIALLALVPGVSWSKKIDCGTLTIARSEMPVQIRSGTVTCKTARRVMRRFWPDRNTGNVYFSLARRQWYCAGSHGQEFTRYGIVAHCIAGKVKVVLLKALPIPGSTRSNPIPLGNVARSGQWKVRVLGTTPDATAIVLAENQFNDPPTAGRQFYIARVQATYVGGDSASFDAGYRLRAVGGAALEYTSFDDSCGVIPDEFTDNDAFTGGTLEGNVCWSVRSSDANSLVMYDIGEFLADADSIYFSLAP